MSGSGGKVGRQLSKLSANEDRKTFMSYSLQFNYYTKYGNGLNDVQAEKPTDAQMVTNTHEAFRNTVSHLEGKH